MQKIFHQLNKRCAPLLFRYADMNIRRRLWLKLATLLSNGVPLKTALVRMHATKVAAKKHSDPVTVALAAWIEALNNGLSFSKAIFGWVSDQEYMLIAAGDESDSLMDALRSTAEIMVSQGKIASAVRGGLIYPGVLSIMTFFALYLFGYRLVPAFTHGARTDTWHGMAKVMIVASQFVQAWLWLLIIAVMCAIIIYVISLRRFDGPIRVWLDKFVPYSVYRIQQGSTFLISVAALVRAGINNMQALEQMAHSANPWAKRRIDGCIRKMGTGLNMGEALQATGFGFPDVDVIDDLATYATVGGFDQALQITAHEWLDEAITKIQTKMKLLFNVSILVLGGVIISMTLGMLALQAQFIASLQAVQ